MFRRHHVRRREFVSCSGPDHDPSGPPAWKQIFSLEISGPKVGLLFKFSSYLCRVVRAPIRARVMRLQPAHKPDGWSVPDPARYLSHSPVGQRSRCCEISCQLRLVELYIGWLHFLDQSVDETKDWDQTLIRTLNFGFSPDLRLAQLRDLLHLSTCY